MGFRESAGLWNVEQLVGRVNREYLRNDGDLWVFELDTSKKSVFTANSDLNDAQAEFRRLWREGEIGRKIGTEWNTLAAEEMTKRGLPDLPLKDDQTTRVDEVVKKEQKMKMEDVGEAFKVIPQIKRTVIIDDPEVFAALENPDIPLGKKKTLITRSSVQLYEDQLKDWPVKPYKEMDGFYVWNGDYDSSFLGYMAEFL